MTFGLEQIILMVVAVVAAYLGFTTGKKRGEQEGEKRGRDQAVTEIQQQSTEQALERVSHATDARNSVERTPDDQLREQASQDPHNRLRGM